MKFNVPLPVRLVLAFLGSALPVGAVDSGGDWSTVSSGGLVSALLAGTGTVIALLAPSGKVAPNDKAVASVQDVVTKTAEAHEKLTTQAVESIERVKAAVGDLGTLLPVPAITSVLNQVPQEAWRQPLGPLAQQAMEVAQGIGLGGGR